MKYETIKTFILVVLVGISFLLSYILWSYQPNYDYFYDSSYVNEVDIGGVEKTKNDLIRPSEVIFRVGEQAHSFIQPSDREIFYQDITTLVLYDYKILDANGRPDHDEYIEIIFPNAIPAEVIPSLFTFEEEVTPPDWSFDRIFLTFNEEIRTLQLSILSADGSKQITATIEKSETYELLQDYMDGHMVLEDYIVMDGAGENHPIYLPKNTVILESKTLVASRIDPKQLIDALFSNPNIVTPNMREAYFTDGQRGMRIRYEGRILEFINPIQPSTEQTEPMPLDLLDKSIANINEHKGWTNNFIFEEIDHRAEHIKYRLYYDGYPMFDHYSLTMMKQAWRNQVLFEYERPLIRIGNLLSSQEEELPSGETIVQLLEKDRNYQLENIRDIQVGYFLSYIRDNHSLILEPSWYILYGDEWIKYYSIDEQDTLTIEGGD